MMQIFSETTKMKMQSSPLAMRFMASATILATICLFWIGFIQPIGKFFRGLVTTFQNYVYDCSLNMNQVSRLLKACAEVVKTGEPLDREI